MTTDRSTWDNAADVVAWNGHGIFSSWGGAFSGLVNDRILGSMISDRLYAYDRSLRQAALSRNIGVSKGTMIVRTIDRFCGSLFRDCRAATKASARE